MFVSPPNISNQAYSMYNPVDEAKVLQILSEPSGNLYLDHPAHFPQTLSNYDFDPLTLRVVDHYNLLLSHNNKLLDRFRYLNREESLTLKLMPNTLNRVLRSLNAAMEDCKEFKTSIVVGVKTVFNFKEGSMYLLSDKFHRLSNHGVFIGIRTADIKTGNLTTLYEQMYSAVALLPMEEKREDVQLVQQH